MTKTHITYTKLLLGGALAVSLLILGSSIAFAQSFYYVNTTGTLRSVEADTPTLAIATAPNIAYNSGVIVADEYRDLVDEESFGTGGGEQTYAYIDRDGDVRTVRANSPSEALAVAQDIAPHSGVKLVVPSGQLVDE